MPLIKKESEQKWEQYKSLPAEKKVELLDLIVEFLLYNPKREQFTITDKRIKIDIQVPMTLIVKQ